MPAGKARSNSNPLLSAKLVFDDHIRCMAAKQRLTKVIARFFVLFHVLRTYFFNQGSTESSTVQNGFGQSNFGD